MVNALLLGNGRLFGMVRFWLVDGGIVCRFLNCVVPYGSLYIVFL